MTDYSNTVFLAGGISNCPDWQKDFVDYLTFLDKDINLTIINNGFHLSQLTLI